MSELAVTPSQPTRWLTRGVLGISLASLFSDWGHEAATALLPALLASLGAPAVALGVIEGVSDGLSSFAKLAGGFIADHPVWRKPTGIIGYFATAITTFAYAFAYSWPIVLVLRAAGWLGRGSRGPSRDALLVDSVAYGQEGRAFGFERAMDSLGAVLGPLSAMVLLGAIGTRAVIRWTLLPGLIAMLAFTFLTPAAQSVGIPSSENIGSRFKTNIQALPPKYWRFIAGVMVHGMGDFAPTLLILRANQILSPRLGTSRAAIISVGLYTFYNVINSAASFPAGAIGDKTEKRSVLAFGYAVGACTYIGFIFWHGPELPILSVLFGFAGIHAAVQSSLEKSLAAELIPKDIRGSAFGVLAAGSGIGDLISSVAVGLLWSSIGPAAGFLYAAILATSGAMLIYGCPD